MKSVNALTSDSDQDALIDRLQDPTYAAIYLQTHLEKSPPDPELLKLALTNVFEALSS